MKKDISEKHHTENTNSFFSLASEFVKAKYHKYCPKIEWIDNVKTSGNKHL